MIVLFYPDEYHPIGTKKIPVRCPDCGNSDCLELTFYQKHVKNAYYSRFTKKVTAKLFCNSTITDIPAVLWTKSIEKYFKSEKPSLRLHTTKAKFSKVFYLLIGIVIAATVTITALVNHQNRKQDNLRNMLSHPEKGMKIKVMLSVIKDNTIDKTVFTWFIVKEVKGDTIKVKRHIVHTDDKNTSFDLDTDKFSGKPLNVSRQRFAEQGLEGFDFNNRTFSGFIMEIKN